MTPRTLCAAALAALALACSDPPGPPAPPPSGPEAMATLSLVEGEVQLERGGARRPAQREPLFLADLIVTGPEGRAVLAMKDGRELELAPGSAFRLGDGKKVDLDFDEGVITIVQEATGPAVLTPAGRTRLEPNTRARVEAKKRGMAIEILTGGIVTIGTDGGALSVAAGQRLELDVGAVRIVEAPAAAKKKKLELVQLEVRMVMDKGGAEVKDKGGKGFRKAEAGEALTPGTEFKLGPAARARLAAPGSEVVLLPGARGAFLGAEQKEDKSQLSVSLKSGATLVRFSGEQKAEVVVEGAGAPARLSASREASVLVAQSPKGPRVQVLTGQVEVVSGESAPQPVRAGEAVAVAEAMKVSPATKPDLVLRLDKRARVFARPAEVGLAVGPEPARLQVAADAEFQQLLQSGEASGVVAVRLVGGELYWRTLDEKGAAVKSGSVRFLSERAASKGDKNRDEVISESTHNVVFQEKPPPLTFEFPAQPQAKSYRLKVFRAGELSKPVLQEEVKTPRATIASGGLAEGSYVWMGFGVDAAGREGASGKMNKVELVYDNSNATLAIHRPAPGGGDTMAEGVAPLGAKLFVNEKPVEVDAKGRFSVEVGKARPLVFRCVLPGGLEDYLVR